MYTMQNKDQDIHDRAQHDNDVPLSPQSVQTGTETSVQCFSTMSQTTYNLVKRRHVSIQTDIDVLPSPGVERMSTGTQTDDSCINDLLDHSFVSSIENDNNDESEESDLDWIPESDNEEQNDIHHDINPAKERKFIVFESCLDNLFTSCCSCGFPCSMSKTVLGSYINIKSSCENCNTQRKWESQPTSNSMPLGNLIIAGAILFSGGSAHKFLTLCMHASVQMFSIGTHMKIQSLYLVPTIENVWQREQLHLFTTARESGETLRLGGDGRCCSTGHTAKYLSYTLMDLKTNKILDTQLVQKNEVRNSYAMELEGLQRGLAKIAEEELQVSHLVTDRHSQIKKYMREVHPEVVHWFDCWHIAKGIFKKLEAVGKKKNCEIIGDCSRSISNHTYWCAMSSEGDGELVSQKWCSILNHVCNVHEGHGNKFPRCEHGDLEDRLWIKKGSKAYEELEKIVKGRLLMTDIKKISPAEQTSGLEAFHKVLCHFAPKFVHYFHAQMEARLLLAALHFNENSTRQQAKNQNGDLIYSVSFPKGRHGEGVAKEVKVKQTFSRSKLTNFITEC
eukprot:XP_019925911.1 PREDICTED: uncharacterized protein LOC109619685 [Crassostrea gigas]